MGRDKAWVEVDGEPMVERVERALRDGGAARVARVGGHSGNVADAFPGEGPLGGIITALRWAHDTVVTAPCDMPWIEAAHVRALAAQADPNADVTYARDAHLLARWQPSALPKLEQLFADGERSPKRALAQLAAVAVDLQGDEWRRDVDSPADLPEP